MDSILRVQYSSNRKSCSLVLAVYNLQNFALKTYEDKMHLRIASSMKKIEYEKNHLTKYDFILFHESKLKSVHKNGITKITNPTHS